MSFIGFHDGIYNLFEKEVGKLLKNADEFRYKVLNVIKENGVIRGRDLAMAFRQRDTRTVRRAIQRLRIEGIPICINKSGGYYYSRNEKDIKPTISDLLSRANELMAVAEGMSKALENKEE